jgi:tetratricopeptide (TPR) repeat protein
LAWYYKGEYDNAIADYGRAIEYSPNYVLAYYNRGLAWHNKGELEKAIDDYDKAVEFNPNYAFAYNNRGYIWYFKQEFSKAISDYSKAIECNPNYTLAFNNRGLAHHFKGEYDNAINDFSKVIELTPTDFNAFINRGIAYYYKGEYNEAIENYKEAILLNDKMESAFNNRGLAYYNKGFYKLAIEDYNEALELNPDYADALNNRGMAWYDSGEYDKAIEDCTKAIQISESFADAYNNRGNAWYFMEDFEKAEADFKKVSEFDGYEAIGFTNIGDVCSTRGEFQKAKGFYEKAHALENIPEWLNKQILQKIDKNRQRINLERANVPLSDIKNKIKIEDRIERTIENIRKVSRSDTRNVVHYTKLFVSDIYVSSINAKMHYSNAIYMNDPMEGKVFFKYLNDDRINQAYLNGEKRNEISVYLGSFLPNEDFGSGKSYEDELVMWRTYGKDENGKEAAGCNLVLSSEFFKQRKKPDTADILTSGTEQNMQKVASIKEDYSKNKSGDNELINVIYVEVNENKRRIKNDPTENITPALEELKNHLTNLIELRDKPKIKIDFYRDIENTIFKQLSTISYLFKTADYIFENEVRVIEYVPRNSDAIKYREVKEPNAPGKRFFIESTNEILPFIRKIYLGPKVGNHQQWSLYFDFEIRRRAKEISGMESPPFQLNPSDIQILKSECNFQ